MVILFVKNNRPLFLHAIFGDKIGHLFLKTMQHRRRGWFNSHLYPLDRTLAHSGLGIVAKRQCGTKDADHKLRWPTNDMSISDCSA
jgi:hypothetical protein